MQWMFTFFSLTSFMNIFPGWLWVGMGVGGIVCVHACLLACFYMHNHCKHAWTCLCKSGMRMLWNPLQTLALNSLCHCLIKSGYFSGCCAVFICCVLKCFGLPWSVLCLSVLLCSVFVSSALFWCLLLSGLFCCGFVLVLYTHYKFYTIAQRICAISWQNMASAKNKKQPARGENNKNTKKWRHIWPFL